MADIQITALPWDQLWRNANPAMRQAFLDDQAELYGNCPCRGPVDIYNDEAPELCDCQTGAKKGGGTDDETRKALGAGFLPLPGLGLLGRLPSWLPWAVALAIAAYLVVKRRGAH